MPRPADIREVAVQLDLEERHLTLHGSYRAKLDLGLLSEDVPRDPSAEIIRLAGEKKADLVIMAARGLGQVGGLTLGSVSEPVLHGAHLPVLVVR